MTIQLLSESPIFHGMTLEILDPENDLLPTLTPQFTGYLEGTACEMWMGDPHMPKPDQGPKALPATGSMKAITAGPITESLAVVHSTVVLDVPEGDIPTQTIKTVKVDLSQRKKPHGTNA